jgi:hypothetical protein
MPDFLNFLITPLGSASINVPRAQIEAKVVDSSNQSQIIADFTGANALIFPAVIATLTAPQRLELARLIADWLLRTKAGL